MIVQVNDLPQQAIDLKAKDESIRGFEKTIDSLKSQVGLLKEQLSQKLNQVDLLKDELENKITAGKAQGELAQQVKDLKSQLKDTEDRVSSLKSHILSGQDTKQEVDSLKQQLASQQDKIDQLKEQLDTKTSQADQMTLIVDEYQKRLESKDNAYNKQLGEILSLKNLNARLREKEAEVIRIKKAMSDLQGTIRVKDEESQAKDLSIAIMQQKYMRERILSGQHLNGALSSDEIDFLRKGFKECHGQVKKKECHAPGDQS